MTRLESSTWSLAGGALTLFVVSVLLKSLPWVPVLVAVAVAVAVWAVRAPVESGVVLAVIGWLMFTGLDVDRGGELRLTGWGDGERLGLLVGIAVAAAAIGWLLPRRSYGPEPGMPGAPEEPVQVPGAVCRPVMASRSRGVRGADRA